MLSKIFEYKIRKYFKERIKDFYKIIFIIVITAISTLAGLTTGPAQRFNLLALYHAFFIRGNLQVPSDIFIVGIDDESYSELGASTRWPFPRKFTATALEKIAQANPRLVIIDAYISKEEQDPDANDRIERALKSGPFVISNGYTPKSGTVRPDEEEQYVVAQTDQRFIDAARTQIYTIVSHDNNIVANILPVTKENDPINKKVPLLPALREVAGYKLESLPGKRDLINYYGEKGYLPRLSIAEVIQTNESLLKEKLENKVIFFGYQSIQHNRDKLTLAKDEFNISASKEGMFGVEVQAHIAGNLIENKWIKRLNIKKELEYSALIVLFASLIGLSLSFLYSVIFSFSLLTITIIGCYWFFANKLLWLAFCGPILLCCILTTLANLVLRYLSAKKMNKLNEKFWDFDTEED